MCFLNGSSEDEYLGPFATAVEDDACSATLVPSELDDIATGKIHMTETSEKDEFLNDIMDNALGPGEKLYHPDQPFYATPPAWMSIDRSYDAVPVFYLTNKLTKEEDEALKAEIETECELTGLYANGLWEASCCFVPWKTGKEDGLDGTLEDMWEIFWTVYTYDNGRNNLTTMVFIDRQSGSDLTTIVVDAIHYNGDSIDEPEGILKDVPFPRLKGFRYGRVPGRDSQRIHGHLPGALMRLNEFMDKYGREEQIFLRPGWPGHGVLSDGEDEPVGFLDD